MSSILKALKRLEKERAVRQGDQVDIARDILVGNDDTAAATKTRSGWPWVLLLMAAGVGLGGWLFLSDGGGPVVSSSGVEEPMAPKPPGKQNPIVPLTEPTPVKTVKMVVPPGRLPRAEKKPVLMIVDPPPARAVLKNNTTSTKPDTAVVPPPAALVPEPSPSVAETARPMKSTASSSHPPLVVSGIVFQDNPDDRLAIINDLPVMIGTTVEGALVEKIELGKVRLSYKGESFEIELTR